MIAGWGNDRRVMSAVAVVEVAVSVIVMRKYRYVVKTVVIVAFVVVKRF